MSSGTYLGNGGTSHTIAVGFAPALVAIHDGTTDSALAFATTAMPPGTTREVPYPEGPLVTGDIVGLTAGGFTVTNSGTFDDPGSTYYWFAWPASRDVQVGSYVGTGAAMTVDVGFSPDWLWVFTDGMWPVQRFAADPATDDVQAFNNLAGGAGIVTSFVPGGFTVGTNPLSNAAGTTYYYVAFRGEPGFATFGAFTGTGAAQAITGLGYAPQAVFGGQASSGGLVMHGAAMGASTDVSYVAAGGYGAFTGMITSLDADGFSVGANYAGTPGEEYLYAAFAP